MARVGFETVEWSNKDPKLFTHEELLEYWYKLRLTVPSGPVIHGTEDTSTGLYICHLQEEILRRMNSMRITLIEDIMRLDRKVVSLTDYAAIVDSKFISNSKYSKRYDTDDKLVLELELTNGECVEITLDV